MHAIIRVDIIYDAAKNARNIALRDLSFERALAFDFIGATYLIDDRHDYHEVLRIASVIWMIDCITCVLWKRRLAFAW